MKPLVELNDYILVNVTVKNAAKQETTFKVGFKYLKYLSRQKVYNKIVKNLNNLVLLRDILRTNIVIIEDILLSDDRLTNSLKDDIIPLATNTNPYYDGILKEFINYLNTNYDYEILRKKNLIELGEYQAKVDDNYQDREAEKRKRIADEFGSIIAFADKEEIDLSEQQFILLLSNKKIFEIFCLARKWRSGFGELDTTVLIQLIKDHDFLVKDVIDDVFLIYSSYLTHKKEK